MNADFGLVQASVMSRLTFVNHSLTVVAPIAEHSAWRAGTMEEVVSEVKRDATLAGCGKGKQAAHERSK